MTGVLCMMALAKICYCVSKFLIQKIKSVISMQGSKKTPTRTFSLLFAKKNLSRKFWAKVS